MAKDKEFTVDDILEEQRRQRAQAADSLQAAREQLAADEETVTAQSAVAPQGVERAPKQRTAQNPAPRNATPQTAPAAQKSEPKPRVSSDTADLNAFATGNFKLPETEAGESGSAPAEPEDDKKGKKKKKKRGLFGRKKKVPDFNEDEDDAYYGIQLKPIDEYRKGYDPATGEIPLPEDSFKALFDDSKKAIDDEVEENFQRLQRERRRRVAQAVQTAGVNEQEIADEFGVVAPMPVTAFAADPYAKQHGIEVEGAAAGQEDMPDIQRAMLETSTDKTMEMKLNIMSETIELQRVKELPVVSEETVSKIVDSAQEMTEEAGIEDYPPVEYPPEEYPPMEEISSVSEEMLSEEIPQNEEDIAPPEAGEENPVSEHTQVYSVSEYERAAQSAPAQQPNVPEASAQEQPILESRPLGQIPQVATIYEYRSRNIPTHVINADLLQSALISESQELQRAVEEEELRSLPRNRRVRNKKLEEREEEDVDIFSSSGEESKESIDDYTGPEDAKSISNELRSDMNELSLRMMITGVCTVLLAVINLIFGNIFSGEGELGASPMVYLILTVIFLGVSIGICYRTIGNGLRALLSFNANSDSAAAVAAFAVALQTLVSVFFRSEITEGKLHLYAVVVSAILFANAAGKLTMIRRIHSNFRFVSSKEQKYSVATFDDYNTSLKMAKESVAEKPLIAYQHKTGFLKRFLELSYAPDPSESASQLLAPIGLIASLVLCIVCLLITRSVPTAISAFAAASCACVAVSNMLSINLPISRLCKTARRAGAMVVGFEAVDKLGNVNAVMVDAEELFPPGTVVLGGIKTFGDRAGAEEAIMAASALMKEIGGPLSSVFDQVISENEDALPEVEKFSYEEEGGIIGKVDGKSIYIGNRALFINHRMDVPAREEETRYASGNKSVVYIGVEERVAAMLVLTYSADRRRKNELQRLEDSGISVLVRTTDPNVTTSLIARLFGIDANSVSILEGDLAETAKKLMKSDVPRADATVATKGRIESMMSVIAACVEQKRAAGMIVAIQNAAVILGFVLVAFMACFGGMRQLSSLILFLFELFWLALIIVLPKLRK